MHDAPLDPFLWSGTPEAVARAREVFLRVGYEAPAVGALLGLDAPHALSQRDLGPLLARTEGGSPLETLVRLFLVGVPEATARVREALGGPPEPWVEAGLLAPAPEGLRGAVRILPFEGLLVAHDLPPWSEGGRGDDYVMGIGSSSLSLAALRVTRPSRGTLDLGTGCGILGLLAARHSERVVALDRNPRAVAFAAFNARLSGLDHVACLESDRFGAVASQRFDLVLCNPPFVVSPESRYVYRDGGYPGDGFVRALVREVPQVLAEGGHAQFLCNWAHVRGQDWRERLAGWFAGTGCDAWVLRTDTFELRDYADRWIRHTERDSPEAYRRRLEAWLEGYRREDLEAVSGGYILMRRRETDHPLFVAEDAPRILEGAGEALADAFGRRALLQQLDDEALLALRPKLSPHARLRQDLEPSATGWGLAASRVALARGLGYELGLDPHLVAFLGRCDGRTSLGRVAERLARDVGRPRGQVLPVLLPVVRSLLERGFLLP